MTTTKRRLTLVNLIILCIVAAAGVAAFRAVTENSRATLQGDDREMVTFTVTFTPTVRDKAVNVQLGAGSAPAETYFPTESPLIVTKMLHRGEAATLLAEQLEPGTVTCKIRAGMRNVGKDKEFIGGAGGVACRGIV